MLYCVKVPFKFNIVIFLIGGGWDIDQDLDLPPEVLASSAGDSAEEKTSLETFVEPTPGRSPCSYWADNSPLAVDHILAGKFIETRTWTSCC